MRRAGGYWLLLAATMGWSCGAESVEVVNDPLPEGAFRVYERRSVVDDAGLQVVGNEDGFATLWVEKDEDGRRVVFSRFGVDKARQSRDSIGLSGSSGAVAADLIWTGEEFAGLFVRLTSEARMFFVRWTPDGTRIEGVVAVQEQPFVDVAEYETPSLPRLSHHSGEGYSIIWPAATGGSSDLFWGTLDLESGEVIGQRATTTPITAAPVLGGVAKTDSGFTFAWVEHPDVGSDRIRMSVVERGVEDPVVDGELLGRESIGTPGIVESGGRATILWSGAESGTNDSGQWLTFSSTVGIGASVRLADAGIDSSLARYNDRLAAAWQPDEHRLVWTLLDLEGGRKSGDEEWTRKGPVDGLRVARSLGASALAWEEVRSDGVVVGVLRIGLDQP